MGWNFPSAREGTFVYVISTLDYEGHPGCPVKIGISTSPAKRLKALQTANPNKLGLDIFFGPMSHGNALAVEQEMHKNLDRHNLRTHGEWFNHEPWRVVYDLALLVEIACIGSRKDEVRYARLSSKLGIAAAYMSRVWP